VTEEILVYIEAPCSKSDAYLKLEFMSIEEEPCSSTTLLIDAIHNNTTELWHTT